jgi:hypothetical protein
VLRVPGLVEKVLSKTYGSGPIDLAPPPSLSATVASADQPADGGDGLHLAARAIGAVPLANLQIYQDGLLTARLAAPDDKVTVEWVT